MNKIIYLFLCASLFGCGGGDSSTIDSKLNTNNQETSSTLSTLITSPSELVQQMHVLPGTTDLSIPVLSNMTSLKEQKTMTKLSISNSNTNFQWFSVAKENAVFSVIGSQKTRYGSGNNWIEKTYTDVTVPCSNIEYGTDPFVGVVKECQIYSDIDPNQPVYSWYTVAIENTSFMTVGTQKTRYGSDNNWIEKTYTDSVVPCTNIEYGNDPLFGIVKSCQIYSNVAPTIPNQSNYSWYKVSTENQTFNITGTQKTRYGSGNNWIEKTYTNSVVPCTNIEYGNDPLVNVVKECDVYATSAPTGTGSSTNSGPYINNSLIPSKNNGFDNERIQTVFYHANDGTIAPECTTVNNNCIIPSALQAFGPNHNDIGAFREPCDFSFMAYDDPIVFPNQSGASHLHTFFGNSSVNAYTTTASISTGNSTCAGGTANRTAYWIPSMIDTQNGQPLTPSANLVYYKCTYSLPLSIACDQIKPLPTGLRMISGNAMNSDPKASTTRYICMGIHGENPGWKTNLADAYADGTCTKGADFIMNINFPYCWDGVNLDSPDHKSHMAEAEVYKSFQGTYPTIPDQYSSRCPSTHPVVLPEISYNIHYTIPDDKAVSRWRLSSDKYDTSLPGGLSGHADYFMGWKPEVMQTFIDNCDKAHTDCHAYLLGNNTMLY